jgi:hypothetical protein
LSLGFTTVDSAGKLVTLDDFNYKYVWLRCNQDLPEISKVEVSPGVVFKLQQVKDQNRSNKEGALYMVINYEELLDDLCFQFWLTNLVMDQMSEANPTTNPTASPTLANSKMAEA